MPKFVFKMPELVVAMRLQMAEMEKRGQSKKIKKIKVLRRGSAGLKIFFQFTAEVHKEFTQFTAGL